MVTRPLPPSPDFAGPVVVDAAAPDPPPRVQDGEITAAATAAPPEPPQVFAAYEIEDAPLLPPLPPPVPPGRGLAAA